MSISNKLLDCDQDLDFDQDTARDAGYQYSEEVHDVVKGVVEIGNDPPNLHSQSTRVHHHFL